MKLGSLSALALGLLAGIVGLFAWGNLTHGIYSFSILSPYGASVYVEGFRLKHYMVGVPCIVVGAVFRSRWWGWALAGFGVVLVVDELPELL